MSVALNKAYASNTETPLDTFEFTHASLTGGVQRFVISKYDLSATLENASVVTFSAISAESKLPSRNVDGSQDIEITLDNTNGAVWAQLNAVVTANRTTTTPVLCTYRPYLESDTSAPATAALTFPVKSSSINRSTATIRASYTPLPNTTFPRGRYYATNYPWLKYA